MAVTVLGRSASPARGYEVAGGATVEKHESALSITASSIGVDTASSPLAATATPAR